MSGSDAVERIRELSDQFERLAAADSARSATHAATIAESARTGELGPDWQKVQRRVDRGETTLTEVFTGRDEAPESTALARASRERTPGLVRALQEHDDADLADALDGLAAVRVRLAATLGTVSTPATPDDGPW